MKHGHRFVMVALVAGMLAVALVPLTAGSQGARAQAGGIIYVDADAAGANNGASWRHAFTDLQDALDEAEPLDQIWVAEGTYKPTRQFIDDDPRSATFQMVNGAAIFGGFDPGTGVTKFADRDWVANETILSGNIGDLDRSDDNSYHVFYHPEGTNLDGSALLDGFTIIGGNADLVDYPGGVCGGGVYNEGSSPTLGNITLVGNSAFDRGGGVYNEGSSPVLTGCLFSDNFAQVGGAIYNLDGSSPTLIDCTFSSNAVFDYGGAMFNNDHSSPVLNNCAFSGNSAFSGGGGAIYNRYGSSPKLAGCTFLDNVTLGDGGGIYNVGSSPVLTNCSFTGNSAEGSGGAVYNLSSSSSTLTNCILWGDSSPEIESLFSSPIVTYSDIQGGYVGEGNIELDPRFVEPDSGDLHLQPDSPCIDAGDNDALNLPQYDVDGDPRILDGNGDGYAVVDMGADEFKTPAIWVDIDVTPYVPSNVIKLGSPRRVPVAILSTEEFNAVAEVAPDSVYFAGAPHVGFTFVDVDNDDDEDVLLDFRARDMVDLDEDSTEATLTGETQDGVSFEGTDEVKVIP